MLSSKFVGYIYIGLTISLTVYAQLILKWRMSLKGESPSSLKKLISYAFNLYLDPWILSGFLIAFAASVTWSLALTKFQLSFAYPFTSISFVLVFIFSVLLFNDESFTLNKLIGLLLICLGVYISSQSK
jgi:multidrug transporter EmrE-like cation transporter